MNEREFCYWLQGLFEVGRVETLDATQVAMVKDHLKLVFTKMTPVYPTPSLNPFRCATAAGQPSTRAIAIC